MPKTINPIITPEVSKNASIISRSELVDMLMNKKGATIATFVMQTEPKMRKTNNPYYGKVKKISRVNVMLNFHYDEGVKRRLVKENKSISGFKQGTSWHEPVLSGGLLTPFCRHRQNGSLYVRCMELNRLASSYRDAAGNEVDYTDIEPFLQKSKSYSNQGLDNPLVFLTYKVDSIKYITINKHTYRIR